MRPPSPEIAGHARRDLADCRALLRHGSHSFFAASYLLPRCLREPASALYAFCRLADDVVDLGPGGAGPLAELHERLDRAYAGRPLPIAADRAFAVVVEHYDMPRQLPEALLEGFQWDAEGRRYEDLGAVHAYSARVAGTVGAMMAVLMGARSTELLARACDLGVAMQLTNIARDVGEDARAGRLYLPTSWLLGVDIDPEDWLRRPVYTEALGSVVQRLLAEAERLYARADAGIARLPGACRPGIRAARLLYAEIGHELLRSGADSVSGRAVVPAGRKLRLLARAAGPSPPGRHGLADPPLAATRFLVEAAAREGASPLRLPSELPWWNLGARLTWMIDLIERLERRERGIVSELHVTPQRALPAARGGE